jgi:hypothetical protein
MSDGLFTDVVDGINEELRYALKLTGAIDGEFPREYESKRYQRRHDDPCDKNSVPYFNFRSEQIEAENNDPFHFFKYRIKQLTPTSTSFYTRILLSANGSGPFMVQPLQFTTIFTTLV